VALYEQVVLRHAQGWPELAGHGRRRGAAQSRQRALALGAPD
jgi:hypothetical protein